MGELSEESLAALVGLVVPPLPGRSADSPSATPSSDAPKNDSSKPATTQDDERAFRKIAGLLKRLDSRQKQASNATTVAGWTDSTADQIQHVVYETNNKEVADFANRTAGRLRAISRSLNGEVVDINADQATMTYYVDRDPGWAAASIWGGVGWQEPTVKVTSNRQQVRERQAAAVKAGYSDRQELWGQIESDRDATATSLGFKVP